MSIKTININDLENDIRVAKYCHLCGEEFVVGMFDTDTICPKCKLAWRKIRDKVLFENERIEE